MSDVLAGRILQLAADTLGEPVDRVSRSSGPHELESWDSLAHLNLVVALEDEFGLEFGPDDIASMSSIGAIVELIQKRLD